jgi:hypothetical protein
MEYALEKDTSVCNKCHKKDTYTQQHCPNCGACPEHQEVRNHSLMWHDGDIHCTQCEAFVRSFDAG